MRRAEVLMHGERAGVLEQLDDGVGYRFVYDASYAGPPISLRVPVDGRSFDFTGFPPFFDGLLPEGAQLEALLRLRKLDREDHFGQLLIVGADLVGAVTVRELP